VFTGLVIGLFVGLLYYPLIGDFLNQFLGWQESWITSLIGFLGIFLPIVIFASWIGMLFRKVFERFDIVWIDAVLGFFMGIIKGIFWIIVITLFITNFSYLQFLNGYIAQSRFYHDITLPVITYLSDFTGRFPQATFLYHILKKGMLTEDVHFRSFEGL